LHKVEPGTSEFFLMTSDTVVDRVKEQLAGTHAQLIHTNLSNDQEAALRCVRCSPRSRHQGPGLRQGRGQMACGLSQAVNDAVQFGVQRGRTVHERQVGEGSESCRSARPQRDLLGVQATWLADDRWMIGIVDLVRAETDLAAGELTCPGCGGTLRPWGHARTRRVRDRASTTMAPRPQRTVSTAAAGAPPEGSAESRNRAQTCPSP
jgi:hypothetical protein